MAEVPYISTALLATVSKPYGARAGRRMRWASPAWLAETSHLGAVGTDRAGDGRWLQRRAK